jgi:hypothetical protein
MEKTSPPPYSSVGATSVPDSNEVERNALLDHLIQHSSDQSTLEADYPAGGQAILDRETERVRNMLRFTLSVDYEIHCASSISAADREHFLHMATTF